MVKVHLCCGKRNFGEHWIHVDGAKDNESDEKKHFAHILYHDVTKLSFEDNSVDLIYCAHGIAYWDRHEILDILTEWRRVLKPGGMLRIATPDIEAMMKLYFEKQYLLTSFLGPMYGKMEMSNATIYHKTVYDFKSLLAILMMSKFKDIKRYDWRLTEHAKHDDHSQSYLPHMNKETGTLISLNVECIK
mgnify:CR=1 FL=1